MKTSIEKYVELYCNAKWEQREQTAKNSGFENYIIMGIMMDITGIVDYGQLTMCAMEIAGKSDVLKEIYWPWLFEQCGQRTENNR